MRSTHSLFKGFMAIYIVLSAYSVEGQVCSNSTIFTAVDSAREVRICPDDGIADLVFLEKLDSSIGASYSFIIADVQDNILTVRTDSILNFEGFDEGFCRIWGVSHSDSLIYEAGMDVITIRARNGGCATLSDNVINVIKESPGGGFVALSNGNEDTTYCALSINSTDTAITVIGSSISGLFYTYVLTTSTNIIISNNNTGTFDLSGLSANSYKVFGLSFAGKPSLILPVDSSLFGFVNAAGFCGELSENNVTINKEVPFGGLVRTKQLDTLVVICPEGGNSAKVALRNTGSTTFPYVYVVTDEAGVVLGISNTDTVDFNGAPPGICLIYGLSYEGELLVSEGDTIFNTPLSDKCFDLSSTSVIVIRVLAEAGMISAIGEEGDLLSCPGDNLPDRFILERIESTPELQARYIVTDLNNVILLISNINVLDFEGSPEGECKIYSVTFSGTLIIEPGDTLFLHPISTGCFDITENHLSVRRFVPDGGDIFVTTGENTIYLCVDQVGSTVVRFGNNSLKPQKYDYVVTNGLDQIIDIIDDDSYTFTELPRGTTRVWGVAYTGTRLLGNGDNLAFSSYSDACFDLSNNFLQVVTDKVFAGQISLVNGDKSRFFCLGSEEPTKVTFANTNQSNSKYTYVLTDFSNRIIQFLSDTTFDFSSIGAGSYRIWGVSYTGNPLLKINDDLLESPYSDDCFDLTPEPIEVIRDNPFAGEIRAVPGFSKAYTCPINDDLDFVKFRPIDAIYLQYAYIVTDTLEKIINFSFIDSIDFGLASIGTCRVYGVAYEGEFAARVGNQLRNIAFSDECWDLSNNYVEIIRTVPVAHNVFTSNGDSTSTVCVGDGGADELSFTTDDVTGIPKAFVATDEQDQILGFSITSTLNFEDAPPGRCRVYSVAYTGKFNATPGEDIHESDLGDDCFEVSNNYVIVDRVDSGPLCVVSQRPLENNKSYFTIAPNPFVNKFIITKTDLGSAEGIEQLEIFNLQGQYLATHQLNGNKQTITVNFPNDVLLVKLSNNKGKSWVARIIKLK